MDTESERRPLNYIIECETDSWIEGGASWPICVYEDDVRGLDITEEFEEWCSYQTSDLRFLQQFIHKQLPLKKRYKVNEPLKTTHAA